MRSTFLPANQNLHLALHTTNQNLCDVTAMFTYSHLNKPINQQENAHTILIFVL